jgi:hypothetical protein
MELNEQTFQTIISFASGLAKQAGNFGVPIAGLAGTILDGADTLLTEISNQSGKTREEIAAAVDAGSAQDIIDLMADKAKSE